MERRAAVVFLLLISAVSASACGGETGEGGRQAPTATSAVVETSPEPTPEPTQTEPARKNVKIAERGFTQLSDEFGDVVTFAVILKNPNKGNWIATSVDLTITFLDGSGTVVSSVSDSVALILPDQTVAIADSRSEVSGAKRMEVQARARSWERFEEESGQFKASGVNLSSSELGGYTVTGTLQSTFTQDFQDVYAAAILRGESGEIVGGSFTFVNFVPAGGDVSVQVDVLDDIPNAQSADISAHLTNLSLLPGN